MNFKSKSHRKSLFNLDNYVERVEVSYDWVVNESSIIDLSFSKDFKCGNTSASHDSMRSFDTGLCTEGLTGVDVTKHIKLKSNAIRVIAVAIEPPGIQIPLQLHNIAIVQRRYRLINRP